MRGPGGSNHDDDVRWLMLFVRGVALTLLVIAVVAGLGYLVLRSTTPGV